MTAPVVDAQPLLDEIKAVLRAAGLAYEVGRKPGNAPAAGPWVVGWPDGGAITDRTLRSRDGWSLRVSFQVYGFTIESVNWALPRLRQAVLSIGHTEVGGRTVLLPSHEISQPLSRDDDVEPPLLMQYDEWRFALA